MLKFSFILNPRRQPVMWDTPGGCTWTYTPSVRSHHSKEKQWPLLEHARGPNVSAAVCSRHVNLNQNITQTSQKPVCGALTVSACPDRVFFSPGLNSLEVRARQISKAWLPQKFYCHLHICLCEETEQTEVNKPSRSRFGWRESTCITDQWTKNEKSLRLYIRLLLGIVYIALVARFEHCNEPFYTTAWHCVEFLAHFVLHYMCKKFKYVQYAPVCFRLLVPNTALCKHVFVQQCQVMVICACGILWCSKKKNFLSCEYYALSVYNGCGEIKDTSAWQNISGAWVNVTWQSAKLLHEPVYIWAKGQYSVCFALITFTLQCRR